MVKLSAPSTHKQASTLANGDGRSERQTEGSTEVRGAYIGRGQRSDNVAALRASWGERPVLAGAAKEANRDGPSGSGAASLVETGLTQPPTPSEEATLSPILQQGLPGLFGRQQTLGGSIVSPPPPQSSRSDPRLAESALLPGQQPLPLHGRQLELCPAGGWLTGTCEHGTKRWIRTSCKKRTCPICGQHRREMIAWRIAKGIEILGGQDGGGWFVGTFSREISKREAVKVQGKMVRWIRKHLGTSVAYAATWEEMRSGRLHINLILAPWKYIPQVLLSRKWQAFGGGRMCWIERVGAEIGVEAAKSRNSIGGYLGKLEQMVMNGKGVTYSKGWPKLPSKPQEQRKGKITWHRYSDMDGLPIIFNYEREQGLWKQVAPGEFKFSFGEECDCFECVPP